MLNDLLYMKSLYIDIQQISILENYVYASIPLVLAVGVIVSHLSGEKASALLSSVLSAMFLMIFYKISLDFLIDLGCGVGDSILSQDNAIVKDWYSYIQGPSQHSNDWKMSDVSSWFSVSVEFITKHLLKWSLFILSIVNTIAYNLVKSTLSIVLLISMIPSYRGIQKGLITYALSTFLWPIFLAVVITILDFIIKDYYDQLTVNHMFGYVIALLFVIGYSYKFVFNMLSGSGPAATLGSIGQSYANSATLMTMGVGATALFHKPKSMAINRMSSLGRNSLSRIKQTEDLFRGKSRESVSGHVGAKSFEKKSLTYGDIASLSSSNGIKNKFHKTMAKTTGANEFVKHKLSKSPLSYNEKFSYSEFKAFKEGSTRPSGNEYKNTRFNRSPRSGRETASRISELQKNSYFNGGNINNNQKIEVNKSILRPKDLNKQKDIPAKDRYAQELNN